VYVWRPEQLQEIEHRLSGCWYWLGMPC
jgi:hypothetical protein